MADLDAVKTDMKGKVCRLVWVTKIERGSTIIGEKHRYRRHEVDDATWTSVINHDLTETCDITKDYRASSIIFACTVQHGRFYGVLCIARSVSQLR